jgi:hypothetical protein
VHVELHGKVQYKAFEINARRLERQAQEALNRAEIVGRWKDRREAVFSFVPIMLQCMSPLMADIVAKVSNRRATIFPPEDKTGRDRRLIWPQAYYRSRR